MAFTLEQALFGRPDRQEPRLLAKSAGFDDAWLAEVERLVLGFGARRGGILCPLTVFGKPLDPKHVAVVRVQDENPTFPTGLRFHFLIVERKAYDGWIRDPFILADLVPPTWDAEAPLPAITIAEERFQPRTLAQVQSILKRIKASALRKGDDPESPEFQRTAENSESPALLGGAQILVDGGRLVFERPQGDLRLVSGLWFLLPEATRCRLWPTSFAFSPELEFDVLVLPQVDDTVLETYTNEEQAEGYPEGTYELALQRAAEQGTPEDLTTVFNRRDNYATIRLALLILVGVTIAMLLSRLDFGPTAQPALTSHQQQAMTGAAIVAAGNEPWTSLGLMLHAKQIWKGEEDARAK